MKKFLTLIFIFCLSANIFTTFAQALFPRGGEAKLLSNRRYRLTEDKTYSAGVVWSTQKINLNKPFDILAKVYLGNNNSSGGDGMAFAFHQQGDYGTAGQASDFVMTTLNPSLAVEIDTYSNSGNNDPGNDHMAIQKNGGFQHGSANNLAGPINAIAGNGTLNIEDGNDHFFRLTWDPATQDIKVYFDCQLRLSLKYNMIGNIFNNDPLVYWGFSGACGANGNGHEVDILRCSALDDYNEKIMCDGATPLEITASYGNSFAWSPTIGLNKNNIRNPIASPSSTTTYVATVQHGCSLTYKDTVKILRPRLTPNDWTAAAAICENKKLLLDATAPDAKTYLWNDKTTNAALDVKKSGVYSVTLSDGNCINVASADITVNPLPIFSLGNDLNFCDNTVVVLDATTANSTYDWSTGSSNPKITVNKTGIYHATVTNDKGCEFSDTINVIVRPSFKINENINICEGTSYTYLGKKWAVDTTLKNVFPASNGCDSTYTLKIKVLKKSYGSIDRRICEGTTYDFYGNILNKKGTYKHNLIAANGCDSVLTLTLKVIDSDTTKTSEYICKNSSYSINNQTFTKDGIYSVKLKNSLGCDSIIILTLTVDKGLGYQMKDTICSGKTYAFDGKNLDKTGNYDMIVKNQKGCDSTITLQLFVQATPPIKISASQKLLCPDDDATLNANGDFPAYTWNVPNTFGKTLIVDKSGWYRVSVTDEVGCQGIDSILIIKSSPIKISVVKKTPSCSGYTDGQIEIKKIEGGIEPYNISIDGNSFSKSLIYKNLREGNYTIYVRDSANCEAQVSEVLANPIPKRIQIAQQDRLIKLGDSTLVTVVPTFSDVANIQWTPSNTVVTDDLEAWLKPLRPTRYSVIVTDSVGCEFTDTVKISIDSRLNLFLPNIFSANIDGTNDDIRPYVGPGVEKILVFRVFDRWGTLVFEALNYNPTEDIGWDGFYKDQRMNEGMYMAHVQVLKMDGDIENIVGEVMLLR